MGATDISYFEEAGQRDYEANAGRGGGTHGRKNAKGKGSATASRTAGGGSGATVSLVVEEPHAEPRAAPATTPATAPPTASSGGKKPYLSVNNALALLAFYIPFVEARYRFFRSKSTEAIAKLQTAPAPRAPAAPGPSGSTTGGSGRSTAGGGRRTSATAAAPPPQSEAMVWFARAEEAKQHLERLREVVAAWQREHAGDGEGELKERDVIIPPTALAHLTVRPAGSYFEKDAVL
ncbi:hypothetical protein STCU_10491 [Strigomonas culicis]|uniref:Uncharacterized protein n=1 Tax=Strigomonas culicis TaxID=28005 RepID=S9TLG5_9TRYP|nr:hypothetical protein STCU_10491 [Strigomonas culicis]|eukprot:EPY17639.1 hypothetical protein STCU_10491 [Strigomonas culicis]